MLSVARMLTALQRRRLALRVIEHERHVGVSIRMLRTSRPALVNPRLDGGKRAMMSAHDFEQIATLADDRLL
jgi:hypothetical protein